MAMLILLILSPLALGLSVQRTTSSPAKYVLQGWVPNACTLVICAPAEKGPKGENGERGLPEAQELRGPAPSTPGPKGDKDLRGENESRGSSYITDLELLKQQIRDLKTTLDDFKAVTTRIQRVLLIPNGVIAGEKIFKTNGLTGDYDAATASCSHMGGTLAMPRSAAENSAIQQIVVWHNKRAVLGITDRSTEGRFEYPDGNAISYSNWAPGEPNNAGNEDCVEVHPDAKWHDRSCFLEFLIVCEF